MFEKLWTLIKGVLALVVGLCLFTATLLWATPLSKYAVVPLLASLFVSILLIVETYSLPTAKTYDEIVVNRNVAYAIRSLAVALCLLAAAWLA